MSNYSYRLALLLSLSSITGLALPGGAEETSLERVFQPGDTPSPGLTTQENQVLVLLLKGDLGGSSGDLEGSAVKEETQIPRVKDLPRPATTVKEWMAQMEAQPTAAQVIGVKLNSTATGLEIILQTADGKPLRVDASKFRTEGNALIAEIPAVLALGEGQGFRAENPVAEITAVQVTQVDSGTIRVSVTGNNSPPKSQVTLKTGELAYSLNPSLDEEVVEIVVTGDQERGYQVPNASTATRTDTPIRDIPASIQVVPRQVLEDRNVRTINEAVETVSGIVSDITFFSVPGLESRIIRGFSQGFNDGGGGNLRNGFRDGGQYGLRASETFEQVEVLKGPASVLFGSLEPGGTINVVTK